MRDLLTKVEEIFRVASPKATNITLTLTHGELVQIMTSLQATDMYISACEEALIQTVRKRKKLT